MKHALLITLYLTGAAWVFTPFILVDKDIYRTGQQNMAPAGEMIAGRSITQHVRPSTIRLQSDSDGNDRAQPCVGVQFATYVRRNQGRIAVELAQNGGRQAWMFPTSALEDNAYRYFCTDFPLNPESAFDLRIRGVEGSPMESPTVWLTSDTIHGEASINGAASKKSVSLSVSHVKQLGVTDILKINHGAFLFGWLCTVTVGLLSLAFLRSYR